MPLAIGDHGDEEGRWVERSDRRRAPLAVDLDDPGAQRRRALALLALRRAGFDTADLAAWFGLSRQHVRHLVRQAEGFAAALGYGGHG